MSASMPFARHLTAAFIGVMLLNSLAATPAPAATPAAPAWSVTSLATPTNFVPGDTTGEYTYDLRIANIGAAATNGDPITITDTLPAGLEVVGNPHFKLRFQAIGAPGPEEVDLGAPPYSVCKTEKAGEVSTVTCTVPKELPGGEDEPAVIEPQEELRIVIEVSPVGVSEGDTLTNHVEVEGADPPPAAATFQNEASSEPAPAGLSFFRASLTSKDGQPVTQAGSHPYQFTTDFAFNTKLGPTGVIVPTGGDVKDVRVAFPPGLIAAPTATELCTAQQFNSLRNRGIGNLDTGQATYLEPECPDSSVVGVIVLKDVEGQGVIGTTPIYNLVPPPGMPAQFGFQYILPFYIDGELRSGSDYGVDGVLHNQSQAKRVSAASVTFWGTPGEEIHDPIRGHCLVPVLPQFRLSRGDCGAGPEAPRPSFRLPTSCAGPLNVTMSFTNWTAPLEAPRSQTSPGSAPTGCNQLEFEPALTARPTTDVADSPTGLHSLLHLPQKAHEDPEGTAQADLKEVTVALPKGLVINPAGANGLDACTPAQVGLRSAAGVSPPIFSPAPAQCPPAARIGSVKVHTPLLNQPLPGSVYVASPYQNPFNSLLAIYIAVHDPVSGVVVKLPGKVTPDPQSGQLTATFEQIPQTPFEDVELDFFGGPAAALRSPAVCSAYSTDSVLTPWSAPESGPPARYSDAYAIAKAPGGGPCPTSEGALPFAPTFNAGALAPIAAVHTPFVVNLRREDGSQELSAVTLSPPPGLLAKLKSVPCCPESALIVAGAKTGRQEEADPSCPPASEIGSVTAGAGAGPAPYYASGRAYLGCPYKGAPLSAVVIAPAVAGPYDLGTVITRIALYIDPETFRVTAKSDPVPRILAGVPLDVRSVTVRLDRPDFMLNPTNCDPMAIEGSALSVLGASAPLSSRFQVGECGRLKFAPKVSLRLRGGTRRGAHPALRAEVSYPPGANYANAARASVALPHSEFLDTTHIRTICTRVQFAAHACPAASIYGYAKATSPLVDYTVEGPVYLRSSSHPLPDLVMALHGPPSQPVEAAVVARVDSVHGGTRVTFDTVPDVPLTKVTVSMQGGKKGLLQNSRNICTTTNRATVKFDAQNGKVADSRPLLKAKCKPRS